MYRSSRTRRVHRRRRGRHRPRRRGDDHRGGGRPKPPPPNRVVIVLFDQMVPQYADQFDMPNFRALRDAGTNFKKAYLGYMASETVIAHNVITSGLEPRSTWAGPTRPTATTPTCSARAPTRCTSPAT